METVKSFLTAGANNKYSALSNNQQNGFAGQRSLPVGNAFSNGGSGNNGAKLSNEHDAKRKDSDNYFYIMWRS